jgi:hypothetical protein
MNTVAAPRDGNGVPAKMAVLNTDTVQGATLVPIHIKLSNGGLLTDTSATISFTMQPVDAKDPNYVNCWLFKGLDGLVYPAVATATGALLMNLI